MGFVNDYRTASQLEEGAEAAEYGAYYAAYKAMIAEEHAEQLGENHRGRFWKKQVRKAQEKVCLCNNRGKNLRSLLGRKLKKLKKKR